MKSILHPSNGFFGLTSFVFLPICFIYFMVKLFVCFVGVVRDCVVFGEKLSAARETANIDV